MKRYTKNAIWFMAIIFAIPVQAITINVIPASGPNGFGSPNYLAWEANAISAIHSGSATAGTPGTPSYYEQAPSVMSPSQNLVTSFISWWGDANPATTFGSEYGGEYGQRLLFGLAIDGEGTQFSISQLAFVGTSTDPGNSLGFSFAVGSYNYGTGYQGILYGDDGMWGGGDDTFITTGPNDQLVDGLVGRGSGNAWWPGGGPVPPGTEQAVIDAELAYLNGVTPIVFSGEYTLHLAGEPPVVQLLEGPVTFEVVDDTVTGQASVTFSSVTDVPDGGSTLAFLGAGFMGLVGFRRLRSK